MFLWARPGNEPKISRTRSENHTPRPTNHNISHRSISLKLQKIRA